MTCILGINAYHGDSSACLVVDGKLIAAAEEERFRRIKHWAGLPTEAIRYCLREAAIGLHEIDDIAVNRNPGANFAHKLLSALQGRLSFHLVRDRLGNRSKVRGIKTELDHEFKMSTGRNGAKVHHVEHHVAHLTSAFLVSPFEKAAVVSVDGLGDFVGAMWGVGEGNKLKIGSKIFFPHSLGLFYLAMTQYLGFPNYGDEYKVMGLAAFGEPSFMSEMHRLVALNSDGAFRLDLSYFTHHSKGVTMTWNGGEPKTGSLYSKNLEDLLGPFRNPEDPVGKRHEDIASSVQAMYEECFFHLLNHVYEKTKLPHLCLAGGCALNSVANGKIFDRTPFRKVYIQAAAGDAGGALGAAYYVWNHLLDKPRAFVMENAYWGPEFSEAEIAGEIRAKRNELDQARCASEKIDDENERCRKTAVEIANGKVVGWFQGRMEWGPRALGNRSIVVDPRREEMKAVLNARIKRREAFRPFAPSILLEKVGEYFEKDYPDPFMIKVYPVKAPKRSLIPAVTHVDGTGRLQTVSKEDNPLYWGLIKEFEKLTGLPLILNTSFNENEPIVCKPREAIDCFLRTKMDVLVLGNYMIRR
jgi:carbamoyltransferase